ncbi:hypothetical protein BJY04DRAFT_200223 [Aspergillus karnatakaensis]|uniref:uncharacterized protein n=1 Tax=Aspergillus karnatakaensis TaxID=1810916 RepID=UPI003CCDA592
MGTETEFVCPRPRNTRACDKCRARKTRCLPQKKPSEAAACQRFILYHRVYTADCAKIILDAQSWATPVLLILPLCNLLGWCLTLSREEIPAHPTSTARCSQLRTSQKPPASLLAMMLSLVSSTIPQSKPTTRINSLTSTIASSKISSVAIHQLR